jgi:alkanesulfonate monooxygenase SsuD/methylene tetrahydromethanopterin reductase-like flavin-dependent oxidoreductase (luciferase family)
MAESKHPPTPPVRREAYIRFLARELIRTADTWGFDVNVQSQHHRCWSRVLVTPVGKPHANP